MIQSKTMGSAKLKDVADSAGVSIATASMALSGKGKISPEVAERVRTEAERIGYKKKSGVFSKKRNGFKYIGILHHETMRYLWNFSRPFISLLEELILEQKYYPLNIHMHPQLHTEEIFQEIMSAGVGAIFAIHYVNEELFEKLEKNGIPIVIINNSNFQKQFYSVLVDDFHGAYEGSQYLIDLGHCNIVFAEYKRPDLPAVVIDRFIGFKKAMDERSIPFSDEQKISVALNDFAELESRLRYLFGKPDRPTAIFAHDDYFAAYILAILKKMNLRTPEDVSIIGPGDVLDYDEPFLPQITTLRINTTLMVKMAWELMLTRLSNQSRNVHVLKVNLILVERGSCKRLS